MTNAAQTTIAKIPPWLPIALQEVGVKETPGAGTTTRISQYLQTCHLPATTTDETPWCSAFVNWCIQQAGFQGTQSASARSWQHWGMPANSPILGSIAVLWRDDPLSGKGHVGFFIKRDATHVWLLGGNQGNGVCIAPYELKRLLDYRTAVL